MNMTRCIFKLAWEVLLVDMAKMLGFRSARALVYCKAASNHHKAWQMIQILYGTTDEMLVPYVQSCIGAKSKPTTQGYYTWLSSMNSPNYLFCLHLVNTYVVALFHFRAGVRRANYDVMLASRLKFAPLFYGIGMTTYQVHIHDFCLYFLMYYNFIYLIIFINSPINHWRVKEFGIVLSIMRKNYVTKYSRIKLRYVKPHIYNMS
jgi:hypothetical protein